MESAPGALRWTMTFAMILLTVKKGCAAPNTVSSPQPSKSSPKTDVETGALDDLDICNKYALIIVDLALLKYIITENFKIIITMFTFRADNASCSNKA